MPATSRPPATTALLVDLFGAGPFSQADALAAGVSRGRLRAALDAGHLVRVRHGVLAPAGVSRALADPVDRHVFEARALVAALRARRSGLGDSAALSHSTAVAVAGMPYPGLRTPRHWPVHLSDDAPGGRQATGWLRHECSVPREHRTVVAGLPVTTVPRTAVDVAAALPLLRALPVVDAAMRRLCLGTARVEPGSVAGRLLVLDPRVVGAAREQLRTTLDEAGVSRGRRRAIQALEVADPAAENGFESVSRAHVLRAGLPRPEVGYPVLGADGRRYWADLAWPDLRVLGEADGHGKYADIAALHAEKDRQESLERAGWRVVRWTWSELDRTPHLVSARVAAALERAGARAAA
ncbi:MAG: hypothetical protein R2737_12525 [Candidatus Nanopelagicales bacterium]